MNSLWVVIRTQKDRKLQTLIEVCTDFASLSPSVNIHRPAEQVFAVEEEDELEDMFAMADRHQWTGPGVSDSVVSPSWVTRCDQLPIVWRMYVNHQDLRECLSPLGRGIEHHSGRVVTFCGVSASAAVRWTYVARCPKPDSMLPYKPAGWNKCGVFHWTTDGFSHPRV